MLMTIYECNFLYVYILLVVFLSLKLYVYFLILREKKPNLYIEYVSNTHDSWFFIMKGALAWVENHCELLVLRLRSRFSQRKSLACVGIYLPNPMVNIAWPYQGSRENIG